MTKSNPPIYIREPNYWEIIGIIFFLLCIGCSKKPSKNLPNRIKGLGNLTVYLSDQSMDTVFLRQQQTFGNNGKAPIGLVKDLTVDSTGRVFIADGKQQSIKVYNRYGRYIKQLGRRGKGPGEFTNITDIQANENQLFARDNNQGKVVIFSVDSLVFKQTVKLAFNRNRYEAIRGAKSGNYIIDHRQGYFMGFYKSSYPNGKDKWKRVVHISSYYFLNKKGKINSQKVLEDTSSISVFVPLPNYTIDRPIGLLGKLHIALSKNNHIYVVPDRSAHFLIKIYTYSGVYQRGFYYPYKNVSLTYNSASEAGIPKYILRGFHAMKLPETWPAVYKMKIDDLNRLWVATIVKDQSVYQWWVLDEDGKLLARFTWPRSRQIKVIKNGSLYVLQKDKATGVESVVRYSIKFTERG